MNGALESLPSKVAITLQVLYEYIILSVYDYMGALPTILFKNTISNEEI